MFISLKQRTGSDQSILGETTTGMGEGYSLSWGPPLVVAEAVAESLSARLRREEAGEVNLRQCEHHRLPHLLMSSAGSNNRGQWGSRRSRWM